ncbi:MAG: hypothetical protein HYZ75_01830 [Elusimicrobia bacterium]|nr:hypothetical protein [Elusimicrobiota bacterium]
MKKKLFKHGGSYAVDLPVSFVRDLDSKTVTLRPSKNGLLIVPRGEFDTIEDAPEFKAFAETLLHDALSKPSKLKSREQVWGKDWDELLKGVPRAKD